MASDKSVVAAAAVHMYVVFTCKHLDEPHREGRFVFECILECILAGNDQAFVPHIVDLFHVPDTLDP